MTMLTWCQKQVKTNKQASHTAGRTKGLNCQATALDRYFASRSRSYKNPGYHDWCVHKNGQ